MPGDPAEKKVKFAGCLLFLCAAISYPARAQLVYECRSTDGTAFFSETSCKSQALRSVGKRGYSSRKPSRFEILDRWGITEGQLSAVERKCDGSDRESCAQLATYHARTLAQAVRDLTEDAKAACKDGHKGSCEALANNKRDIRKSMEACKAGDKASCATLSRMAQ